MYAPTHVNVWTCKSIHVLAAAAGLCLFRVTEASLASWLATGCRRGVLSQGRDILRFLARKLQVLSLRIGAETVYYLRKPTEC
jgi:hypothetical protein